MSYLYNAYEGSLAELQRRLEAVDEDERPELLDEVIDQTWTRVGTDLMSEVDWHELDDVVALAERRVPQAAALLHGLFVDPPLEIHPDGFGWSGRLTADEPRTLLESLRMVLAPDEIELVSRRTIATRGRSVSRSRPISASYTSTSPSTVSRMGTTSSSISADMTPRADSA